MIVRLFTQNVAAGPLNPIQGELVSASRTKRKQTLKQVQGDTDPQVLGK